MLFRPHYWHNVNVYSESKLQQRKRQREIPEKKPLQVKESSEKKMDNSLTGKGTIPGKHQSGYSATG